MDLLIVGCGGGFIEDLWVFNEECVVEVIFEFCFFVIFSVGYEIDIILVDFVVDCRVVILIVVVEFVILVIKIDILFWIIECENRMY